MTVPGKTKPLVWVLGLLTPAWTWLKTAAKTITGLGWTMISLAAVAWVAGKWFGWDEAGIVAVFCLVALSAAALFTIGGTDVAVSLTLSPARVLVGQSAMASFEITNQSNRRQSAIAVRLQVGPDSVRYRVPVLAPGENFEDWVTIPTHRRGVVKVGPILTYRDDPWGMISREVVWTQVEDLFIHPDTASIDEIGTGLLRDLEGQTTTDVSTSDLAFHTLREYIPGDDQRHIHWKSTARLSRAAGEERFMVRQFLDTRKTHIAIVSDLDVASYCNEAEFELSLSCAASIAVRALVDEMDLTILCGDEIVSRPKSNYALDTYSRAQLGSYRLEASFHQVRSTVPDASMVVLITGDSTSFEELLRGRVIIPYTVRFLVIRVSLGHEITLRHTSGLDELTVGSLQDLPKALRGGLS